MITIASDLPSVEQYERLTPIAQVLYTHMDHLAQLLLLPCFLVSVIFAYSQDLGLQGAIVSRVKRLVVTSLLLAAFPMLSSFIRDLGQEIALSIDDLQGLDAYLAAASKNAASYSTNVMKLFEFGNDILVSCLVKISYLLLYFARFFLVAFYHFYWLFLLVTAPLLILGYLFENTSNLPKNLFKNLILVACWPIVWSILSAFLKGLPYIDAYSMEGGYNTIVVMNLILATSLLFSPLMLSQFCEGTIVGGSASTVYAAGKTVTGALASHGMTLATGLAQKAAPRIKPFIPKKEPVIKWLKKGLKKQLIIVALFGFGGTSSANAFSPKAVNLHPTLSGVLCFSKRPEQAFITEKRSFSAKPVGTRLLLEAHRENRTSSLVVFFPDGEFSSYKLSSNKILPHSDKTDCNQNLAIQKTESVRKAKISQPIVSNSLKVEIASAQWSNRARDHLTLMVRIKNNGEKVYKPLWQKIELRQSGKLVKHSKLWAERSSIEPNAIVNVRIEFTRPSLATGIKATLLIPDQNNILEIVLPNEVLK